MARERLETSVLAAMARDEPMAWGVDDCALWCANILREALGYDAAASYRGRYKTRRGALRVLGRGGLEAAIERAAALHGWQPVVRGAERTGDIGIIVNEGITSTVICRAPGWFVGRNEHGWSAVKAEAVKSMWSVA